MFKNSAVKVTQKIMRVNTAQRSHFAHLNDNKLFMENPFKDPFRKSGEETSKKEPIEYTGETKFTEDETGAVVSEEMKAADEEEK